MISWVVGLRHAWAPYYTLSLCPLLHLELSTHTHTHTHTHPFAIHWLSGSYLRELGKYVLGSWRIRINKRQTEPEVTG